MGLCVPDGRKAEQSKQRCCPLPELICKGGPESQAVPTDRSSVFYFSLLKCLVILSECTFVHHVHREAVPIADTEVTEG